MYVKGKAGLSGTEVLANSGCGLNIARRALQQYKRVCDDAADGLIGSLSMLI